MLKPKKISTWAKEVARCEKVIDTSTSEKEIEQAKWKIENIISMFENNPKEMLELIMETEKIVYETVDK